MFDELLVQQIYRLGLAAALIGAAIGLLPRSRFRMALIWSWALMPLVLAAVAVGFAEAGQLASSTSFMGMFLLATLLPWAGLSLVPYNLVRRWRELRAGINYRNGS